MSDDAGVAETDLLGARALREWLTGEREAYSRVFLVESGAAVEAVQKAASPDDVVLLPPGSAPDGGPAAVAHYTGELREVGDELFFGERGVELQDYVAAAFVQIIGPTAIRFFDAGSWRAFLDDADLARRTGVFPRALIDPRVLLADRTALVEPGEVVTPSAVRVAADGSVSVGVQGEVIGTVDDLQAVLATPLPRSAALGGVAPRHEIAAEFARLHGIARYLNATDLMKMLRLTNGDARIAGFGWAPIDDQLADAEPLTADPFLLDTADGFVLADTRTLRRQLLTPLTATVVAATQTSSTLELAAERLARDLETPVSHASVLCLEAVAALGVHFGERTGSEPRKELNG
jgi:hypothetical protein